MPCCGGCGERATLGGPSPKKLEPYRGAGCGWTESQGRVVLVKPSPDLPSASLGCSRPCPDLRRNKKRRCCRRRPARSFTEEHEFKNCLGSPFSASSIALSSRSAAPQSRSWPFSFPGFQLPRAPALECLERSWPRQMRQASSSSRKKAVVLIQRCPLRRGLHACARTTQGVLACCVEPLRGIAGSRLATGHRAADMRAGI